MQGSTEGLQDVPSLKLYILCFNRPDFAQQAIESAVRQTTDDFDLVISDNSTSDAVQEMVRSRFPQLEYRRRTPSVTALEHFNQCLSETSAGHICLFHDDDLLCPRFVERVSHAIKEHPEVVAIAPNAWLTEGENLLRRSIRALGKVAMVGGARDLAIRYFGRYQQGFAPFSGYVYSMEQIKDLRFDLDAGKYSDVIWLLRVAERGPVAWLTEPLMVSRIHSGNDSRQESLRDRLKLLAYFKRQQQALGQRLIDDYRFFLYKKWLRMEQDGLIALQALRRDWLRRYVFRYRLLRVLRLDQHSALIGKLVVDAVLWIKLRLNGSSHNPC